VLAKGMLEFFSANNVVSIIWPPCGLALAALLLGGKKYWPGVFVGAIAGNIMAGSSVGVSIGIATGNTFEALTGVWLLTRINSFDKSLTHSRDYWWLIMAGAASACVSALIGVATLRFAGFITPSAFTQNLITWWQGDLLGISLVTPLILVWRQVPRSLIEGERLAETIACFGLAFGFGQIIFLGWFQETIGFGVRGFLMFALVTWAAVRFGRHGALLVIAMTSMQALMSAALKVGYFRADLDQSGQLHLWLYLLTLSMVGIELASTLEENKAANLHIQRLNQLYKALSEINQAIIRMEQQTELFPLVCKCAVEFGGMDMAWIGQVNQENSLFFPVASYGLNLDYLDGITISSCAGMQEGLGPSGMAWREGKSVVVNDYANNPIVAPWRERSFNPNWGSSAAFPITRGGRPYAVLSLYHLQINAFDDKAIALLDEMSKDITFALDNFDREAQRKSAEESMRLTASVYETCSEAILITDANNRIIAINPAFTQITGYLKEDVIGQSPKVLKTGKQDQAFYRAMWDTINSTGKWQGEIFGQRKNGEIYPKWLSISAVFNNNGSVHRYISLFADISEKKQSEVLIWQQANFDPLTGLPNRGMFQDRYYQEIKKSHRTGLPLAVLFIDLDHFKEINDTLGHSMGDILLQEATKRLTGCVRESDTVARFGGDEFIVLLSELDDPSTIARTSQDILKKLAEPFHLRHENIYISASIGIAIYPKDGANIEDLLSNADQAMYQAKDTGRNRFCFFTQTMQKAAQARMWIANELHDALDNRQFWVAYQPIVELATGTIDKAEALIRWQHPSRGLISPAEFIPIAESTGLIVEIGEWIFREVANQVKHWREMGYLNLQVSVNKSPAQFYRSDSCLPSWFDYTQSIGLPIHSIVVEITEGLLLDASATITDKLLEFRNAGIQVSLDDFGTGYSSLSYLKKFDIDYLKIDQSFVKNLTPDSNDMALCEAIIVMAHKLGIKVIAEGIETIDQKNLLTAAGCDYGQGYLWSKPVPSREFEAFLRKIEN
jgi:diguanylate cyclase (GGDEF)-like protein/PAS domain S-box-containing protein